MKIRSALFNACPNFPQNVLLAALYFELHMGSLSTLAYGFVCVNSQSMLINCFVYIFSAFTLCVYKCTYLGVCVYVYTRISIQSTKISHKILKDQNSISEVFEGYTWYRKTFVLWGFVLLRVLVLQGTRQPKVPKLSDN